MVSNNLEILHAALSPKKNNFPKIPNRKIRNNNSNIFFTTPLIYSSNITIRSRGLS